ncbi:MAG: ribosome silencing factor [Bilophila sp.]
MEQNNTPSPASEATPEYTTPAKRPRARKYSTAPAAEKTAVLAQWLEDNKGRDVVALDVAGKSPCMDVVVVVTASSLRHAQSLADGLMQQCTEHNYEFLRMEGYQTAQWVLVDLNDIVVHIFQSETRDLFRLEALWKQTPVLHGAVADTRRADVIPFLNPDRADDEDL